MDLLGWCVSIRTDICITGRRLPTSRGREVPEPDSLGGYRCGSLPVDLRVMRERIPFDRRPSIQ